MIHEPHTKTNLHPMKLQNFAPQLKSAGIKVKDPTLMLAVVTQVIQKPFTFLQYPASQCMFFLFGFLLSLEENNGAGKKSLFTRVTRDLN